MVINFNPLLQEKKPSLKKIDLGETECSCCLPECIIDVMEPQNLESQKSIRWCQRIQTSQEQRMNDQIGMYSVKDRVLFLLAWVYNRCNWTSNPWKPEKYSMMPKNQNQPRAKNEWPDRNVFCERVPCNERLHRLLY